MTSTTHGRLPPAVYWRRRLFVLGVAFALVLLAINVVRGDGGSLATGDVASQMGAEPTSPSVQIDPLDPDTSRGSGKGKGKGKGKNRDKDRELSPPVVEEPPATVLAEPSGTCADEDVAVTPFVQGAVAGRPVTVTLRLRTIEAEACTWRVTDNHLALKITTDGQEVWSTRECPRQVAFAEVVVRQAVTSTLNLTWNARYSDPGCPGQPRYAQPGAYAVQAAAYGGEPSAMVDFELAQPTT